MFETLFIFALGVIQGIIICVLLSKFFFKLALKKMSIAMATEYNYFVSNMWNEYNTYIASLQNARQTYDQRQLEDIEDAYLDPDDDPGKTHH